MPLAHPLIDVNDLIQGGPGVSAYVTPITGEHGSSTGVFHAISQPGDMPRKHRHNNCDEISILVKGSGVFGVGDKLYAARAGDCKLAPKGVDHFFANRSDDEALLIGFYLGAPDSEAAGTEQADPVTEDYFDRPVADKYDGVHVNIDEVQPENMDQGDGWMITDFRLPISARNGCSSTLFRAKFMPGAVHKKHVHQNCEEIYYVISGHGLAGAGPDRVEVHGGHYHYIPKGVEHWLHNLSDTEPIEVVGLYINAGSVADTGYVFKGDVTADDLKERTL